MGWTAFTSRMGRRIAWVLGLCAAVPVVLFAIVAAGETNSSGAAFDERRLTDISSLFADIIRARIGVAETLVETFTVNDIGSDHSILKAEVANSRTFKSVVVVNRDGLLADGGTTLRPSPAQSLALEAGQTILMPVTFDGQLTGTFLVRPVNAAGVGKLVYFEMAPDWLWKDLKDQPGAAIAVVDADGKVLQSPRAVGADTNHMFAEHITLLASAVARSTRFPGRTAVRNGTAVSSTCRWSMSVLRRFRGESLPTPRKCRFLPAPKTSG